MPTKPTPVSAEVELEQLRAEVARLRELIGPNEQSYIKLKTDIWGARDAVIGAEAEVINRLKRYRILHRRVIGRARRTLVK